MGWTVQVARKGYYQAVWGSGDDRVRVSLGALDAEQVESARKALTRGGEGLLRWAKADIAAFAKDPQATTDRVKSDVAEALRPGEEPDGEWTSSVSSVVKRWALDDAGKVVDSVVAGLHRAEVEGRIERREYGQLRLRDFFKDVWTPIRSKTRPGSWKSEERYWRLILADLGDVRLDKLDMIRWDAFILAKPWAARSKALCWNAYKQGLIYAKKVGAIKAVHECSPVEGSTIPAGPPPDVLTHEEIQKLLDATACKGKSAGEAAANRALYAYIFGQGVGPKPARLLDWTDLSLVDGLETVHVRDTKNRHRDRYIPLVPMVARELRAWWERNGSPTSGLVFPDAGDFKKGLKAAAKRAGFGNRRIVPYSGRHSMASNMAGDGVPMAVTVQMMGGASGSTIAQKRYVHQGAEHLRESLSRHVPGMAGGKK